jgi:hypothetical protein
LLETYVETFPVLVPVRLAAADAICALLIISVQACWRSPSPAAASSDQAGAQRDDRQVMQDVAGEACGGAR